MGATFFLVAALNGRRCGGSDSIRLVPAIGIRAIPDAIGPSCDETGRLSTRSEMSSAEFQIAAPDRPTQLLISVLGWLMMALAALLAIIPRTFPESAVNSIGSILLIAGVLEMLVGACAARWATASILGSGIFTVGLALTILVLGPHTFFTLSAIVTVWLIARAVMLLILAFRAPWRAAMTWLLISGLGNLLLASGAAAITMSALVAQTLFGPTLKGSGYSIVPAMSLLFNGVSFAAAAIARRRES